MVFGRREKKKERTTRQLTNIWRNKFGTKRKLFTSPNTSHHHPSNNMCRKKRNEAARRTRYNGKCWLFTMCVERSRRKGDERKENFFAPLQKRERGQDESPIKTNIKKCCLQSKKKDVLMAWNSAFFPCCCCWTKKNEIIMLHTSSDISTLLTTSGVKTGLKDVTKLKLSRNWIEMLRKLENNWFPGEFFNDKFCHKIFKHSNPIVSTFCTRKTHSHSENKCMLEF